MCVAALPPPSSRLTRRRVLAGAAALTGIAAAAAPTARFQDGVRSAEALRRVFEVNLARGADVIKTRVNVRAGLPEQDPLTQVYSYEQLSEIVAAAQRGGKGVLYHSYSEKGCQDAVAAGIRSLEHGVFVGERTLHEMRRRGTYFTPTLAAIAGMVDSPGPVLAERGRTYLPTSSARCWPRTDVLHLPRADFTPGAPAGFVLVRGECLPQVVVDMPQRDMVVHGGRGVARDGELTGQDA